MTKVKICGLTREADVMAAIQFGADFLGFIHVPTSPRFVTIPRLKKLLTLVPETVKKVIVVQDETPERLALLRAQLSFDYFQFHGHEPPDLIAEFEGYKVLHIRQNQLDLSTLAKYSGMVMLDTQWGDQKGGSGRTFNWSLLTELQRPFMVAGGLHPENVAALVADYHPWAVDVSSGVEHAPGEKDHLAISQFISEVRSASP